MQIVRKPALLAPDSVNATGTLCPSRMNRVLKIAVWYVATLLAFVGRTLCAQEDDAADYHPLRSADTSSPRATLTSFIDNFDDLYRRFFGKGRSYRREQERRAIGSRVLRCLNLSEVPESIRTHVGSEASVCLKEVLDRIELPPADTWPWPDTEDIENIGRRPYIRRTATIQMPSHTPVAKVNRALDIVRGALNDHEGMKEEFPPRVFLRDVNEGSIGIFLIYWFHPPNYWDYLAFSEKINLQIMTQFEAEQILFAKPALTVHLAESGEQAAEEPL